MVKNSPDLIPNDDGLYSEYEAEQAGISVPHPELESLKKDKTIDSEKSPLAWLQDLANKDLSEGDYGDVDNPKEGGNIDSNLNEQLLSDGQTEVTEGQITGGDSFKRLERESNEGGKEINAEYKVEESGVPVPHSELDTLRQKEDEQVSPEEINGEDKPDKFTVEEFREMFAFKKTWEELAEERRKTKQQEKFREKTEKASSLEENEEAIERRKKLYEEYRVEHSRDPKYLYQRIVRKMAIRKLVKIGITDAEEMVAEMEKDASGIIVKEKQGKISVDYSSLFKYPTNFTSGVSICGNGLEYAKLLRRAEVFTGNVNDRYNHEFLKVFSQLDENGFDNLIDQLKQFPFVFYHGFVTSRSIVDENSNNDLTRKIFSMVDEEGRLSDEVILALEKANEMLSADEYLREKDRSRFSMMSCLDNPNFVNEFFDIWQNCDENFRGLLGRLDASSEENISKLASLARAGVYLDFEVDGARRNTVQKAIDTVYSLINSENAPYLFSIFAEVGIISLSEIYGFCSGSDIAGNFDQFMNAIVQARNVGRKLNPNFRFEYNVDSFVTQTMPALKEKDEKLSGFNNFFYGMGVGWGEQLTEEDQYTWILTHDRNFGKYSTEFYKRNIKYLSRFFDESGKASQFFYELIVYDGEKGSSSTREVKQVIFNDEVLAGMELEARLFFGLFRDLNATRSEYLTINDFVRKFINGHNYGQDIDKDLGGKMFDYSGIEEYVQETRVIEKDKDGEEVERIKYIPKLKFIEEYFQLDNENLGYILKPEYFDGVDEKAKAFWMFFRETDHNWIRGMLKSYFTEGEGNDIYHPNFVYDIFFNPENPYLEIIDKKENGQVKVVPTLSFFEIIAGKFNSKDIQMFLTSDFIDRLDGNAKIFWEYMSQSENENVRDLLKREVERTDEDGNTIFDYDEIFGENGYLQEIDGEVLARLRLITELFLVDMNSAISLLDQKVLDKMNDKDKVIWTYFKEIGNYDLKRFFINNIDTYVNDNGDIDKNRLSEDFIESILVRPENCGTYENLSDLFARLAEFSLDGEVDLASIFMKIAVSHRLGRIRASNQRTEVEALSNLNRLFKGLYRDEMTSYEKLAWRILQRQLPFAETTAMGAMRQQALVVEAVDSSLLSWVHQSVHNHASVHELAYLKSFRDYLISGDSTEFDEHKEFFNGNFRAPDYSEEQYEKLKQMPNLLTSLDLLIDLATRFYEINPNMIKNEISILTIYEGNNDLIKTRIESVNSLIELINQLSGLERIESDEQKDLVINFCLNANLVRRELLEWSIKSEPNITIKPHILNIDTLLDAYLGKVFVLYSDYIKGKDILSTEETVESLFILRELCNCALINGELSEDMNKWIRIFTIRDLEHLSDEERMMIELHKRSLFFPIFKLDMNSYWKKFMTKTKERMLVAARENGLSEREARSQVEYNDLVDFRKTSTLFLIDDLIDLVQEKIKELEERGPGQEKQEYFGYLSKVDIDDLVAIRDEELKLMDDKNGLLEIRDKDLYPSDVIEFIENLSDRKVPELLEELTKFLTILKDMPETLAYKIALSEVREFIKTTNNHTEIASYTKIVKDGKVIEFYPFSYNAIDMLVIKVDGKIIDKPDEFLVNLYKPPVVVLNNAKREGD